LRRSIYSIAQRERKFWKVLSEDDLRGIDAIHERFEDHSLSGVLRQLVGPTSFGDDTEPDLTKVSAELLRDQEALSQEWGWLTSGDAQGAWRLGEALSRADVEEVLDAAILSLPDRGPDLRLICGYLSERRRLRGAEWLDQWVSSKHAAGLIEPA